MQNETELEKKDLISDPDSIFNPEALELKLNKMLEKFHIPEWVLDNGRRICLNCGVVLSKTSVREVGLCLNPQNIGDIQVEIMCNECHASYYLVFRKVCGDFEDFSRAMDYQRDVPVAIATSVPIQGHSLEVKENNLTDAIIDDIRRDVAINSKTEKEDQDVNIKTS